ncbi:hypothetical protein L211DRAFT_214620 [Terfezia boudieri ATCC MYA-4762]|uniref:Uncharacterized protein n=1 Tax=Terfezia boudieri ATCC MYA-4762 TaxID=1051890 RepID=A0A3N4M1L8_9PEZI|nr:hypothetical protein L211DRAFT_214620 [Terfezia boudieri ATCC MYA-4762]
MPMQGNKDYQRRLNANSLYVSFNHSQQTFRFLLPLTQVEPQSTLFFSSLLPLRLLGGGGFRLCLSLLMSVTLCCWFKRFKMEGKKLQPNQFWVRCQYSMAPAKSRHYLRTYSMYLFPWYPTLEPLYMYCL